MKSLQSQWAKAEKESWWLSLAKKSDTFLFYLLILFLPTQLGKHFWPNFSFVLGSRVDYLSPTVYITDLIILLLFFASVIKRNVFVSWYFSLIMLFLGFVSFFATSPLLAWYGFVKFLELSFVVWYVARNTHKPFVVGVLLVLGTFTESFLAFFQVLHQGSIGGLFYFLGERTFSGATPGVANASVGGELILRPYATFSHPNMLAGYVIVVVLLILYFLGTKRIASKLLIPSSLIVGTMALMLSLSRVAIVSWILVGAVMLCVVYREKKQKLFLFSSLLVVTTFLLTAVFFPASLERVLSFSFGESLTQRVILAKNAVDIIVSHPVLGVGLCNFIPSLPDVARDGVILQPVHNIYLLVAAETGLLGFMLFLFLIAALVRCLQRKWHQGSVDEKNKTLLLFLALFTILFSGFFDHYFLTLQQGQLSFALVIGLILRKNTTSATIHK
ncbi:MAG TPA: O-antigen ligase family protein [Patescibacteria group bacterium]|nr:O-antigen ligase family protein [Patescibacteria group bacterium]